LMPSRCAVSMASERFILFSISPTLGSFQPCYLGVSGPKRKVSPNGNVDPKPTTRATVLS
jgi:hypothetical protein